MGISSCSGRTRESDTCLAKRFLRCTWQQGVPRADKSQWLSSPTASLKSFRTGIICLFHVVPGNPVVPGIPGCSRILELESSKIRYTPSAYNYSDILTKPLTEVMFQRMIEMDQKVARLLSVDIKWRDFCVLDMIHT